MLPLLGASGEWGDPWTPLANDIVSAGAYDTVVLIPAAIGGTNAELWTRTGRLHPVLADAVRTSGYAITHVFWVQGESDYVAKTAASDYRASILDIVSSLREDGVAAPFYVATATHCAAMAPKWRSDNAIAHMQKALSADDPTIRRGVDADALLTAQDRYDDCHLNQGGVAKLSTAWLDLLRDRHATR